MGASDTESQTKTLLKREHFWRAYRNQSTPEGRHTFSYWKPPTHGPVVV